MEYVYCCTSLTYAIWLVCDLVESTVHPVLFGPMLDWTYLWKSTVRPVNFVWWVCHLSFQSTGTSFPNNFVLSVNWNLLPSCCFSKVSRMYNRCVYVRLCMYVLSCVSSVRVFLVGFVGIECGLRSKGTKSAQIFRPTSSKAQEEVSSQLFVTLG